MAKFRQYYKNPNQPSAVAAAIANAPEVSQDLRNNFRINIPGSAIPGAIGPDLTLNPYHNNRSNIQLFALGRGNPLANVISHQQSNPNLNDTPIGGLPHLRNVVANNLYGDNYNDLGNVDKNIVNHNAYHDPANTGYFNPGNGLTDFGITAQTSRGHSDKRAMVNALNQLPNAYFNGGALPAAWGAPPLPVAHGAYPPKPNALYDNEADQLQYLIDGTNNFGNLFRDRNTRFDAISDRSACNYGGGTNCNDLYQQLSEPIDDGALGANPGNTFHYIANIPAFAAGDIPTQQVRGGNIQAYYNAGFKKGGVVKRSQGLSKYLL